MSDQVNGDVIRGRSKKLRKLGERLQKKYHQKFKGKEVDLLVENIDKEGIVRGYSENYLDITSKEIKDVKVGEIVKIKI